MHYLCSYEGDMEAAQSILQTCITQDNTFSDAHILMAQIHLYQNNFKAANQSLEVGLSYNFEVCSEISSSYKINR